MDINRHIKIGEFLQQLDNELNELVELEIYRPEVGLHKKYKKSSKQRKYFKNSIKALGILRSNLEKIMFLENPRELEKLTKFKSGYDLKIYFGSLLFPFKFDKKLNFPAYVKSCWVYRFQLPPEAIKLLKKIQEKHKKIDLKTLKMEVLEKYCLHRFFYDDKSRSQKEKLFFCTKTVKGLYDNLDVNYK